MTEGRCTLCGQIKDLTGYTITSRGKPKKSANLCDVCAAPVEKIMALSDGRRLRADMRMPDRVGVVSPDGTVRPGRVGR